VTPLEQLLRDMITAEGPIPVERYMALCLAHPDHGYYMTRDPLGTKGDFITSPEISQMFGELLGLFVIQLWLDLGEPDAIRLVECGPGRGTLMQDLLRAARIAPGFLKASSVTMLETSPVLKKAQQARLHSSLPSIQWETALSAVPDDRPMILIANEFLDALPVRQYQHLDGRWHERMVGLTDGALAIGLAPVPEAALRATAAEGAILEVSPASLTFIRQVARKLKTNGGLAVFIDYGHTQSGFGETLQAVRNHQPVSIFSTPGEADLTAHVDFAAIAKVAEAEKLVVFGPVDQATFLEALGIEQRAETLQRGCSSQEQSNNILTAMRRLTDRNPDGMGALFKVIALATPEFAHPSGFPLPEKTRT
jgi:NADH dehydrogenase [ubiquinone] 1 alpha subcomplex assembly factor 7